MARIKLKAGEPFDVLTAIGLAAGTEFTLIAITDTETLLVYDTVGSPDVAKDQCLPIVYGTQAVTMDATSVGAWLYSDDNAHVYVDKDFDATWLANNPQ